MKHLLTIISCFVVFSMSAQITSITYEVDTIFGSGAIDDWGESLEGFVTYEIYAEFTNPDDKMIAIYGDPSLETLHVDAPCGCYNPLIGDVLLGADISSLFFEFYPSIEFDTYWTLGYPETESFASNEWGAEFSSTTMCSAVVTDGLIYTTAEYAVEAGPDLRMKIAQITTCDSFELNACFEVWVEGVSPAGNSDHPGAYCMSEDGDGPLFVDVMFAGCMDESACNFIPSASIEDDSCQYANDGYDCEGLCLFDFDGDGICDEFEISGCLDTSACNYNSDATDDDGSCIPSGCMETAACNYNELAECEGEECVYSCCPGPGCCLEGTTWDTDLGGCIPTESSCPEDLDFDGVVGVNDLMELLSAFGTDCPEPGEPEIAEWTCGDPVSYHGYDYETVLIGEQCWYAENLRTELYQNGDSIENNLAEDEWEDAMIGAVAVYGEGESNCTSYTPDYEACDEEWSLSEYGRLYNGYTVQDARDLCPVGWHVPADWEWTDMTDFLGGASTAADNLKATYGWLGGENGANSSGFNALPGGVRNVNGEFDASGSWGNWWSSSLDGNGDSAWYRGIHCCYPYVQRNDTGFTNGISVRCIKD